MEKRTQHNLNSTKLRLKSVKSSQTNVVWSKNMPNKNRLTSNPRTLDMINHKALTNLADKTKNNINDKMIPASWQINIGNISNSNVQIIVTTDYATATIKNPGEGKRLNETIDNLNDFIKKLKTENRLLKEENSLLKNKVLVDG